MKKLQIMAGMLSVLLLAGCGGAGASAKTTEGDPPQVASAAASGTTAAQNGNENPSEVVTQDEAERPGPVDAEPSGEKKTNSSAGEAKPAAEVPPVQVLPAETVPPETPPTGSAPSEPVTDEAAPQPEEKAFAMDYPWWAMTAAAILVQAALLIVYQTRIGNWLVPAGIGVLLLLSLALNKFVLPGFGTLANDFLTLLTKKTGKIYLDLAAADAQFLPLAVTVLLLAVSLLLSRSAWSGRMLLALPILLPCYAALLLGLFPMGIGGGLLIIGTVLLMVQHTAEGEALAGVPAQLILPVLCAALCLLIGLSCQDKLNTDMVETMQTQLHQRHYDSDTNSMPEGNLKNLPAWNKSDTPALEVTMEQPEKVYLRGQVYDTYTGANWKAADTEETAQYEDLFYWLHEAGFYGQSQIALADGYTETATPLSMTIRNLSACSAHGYYPYAVYGSETLAADRIGDTNLPPAESLYYLKGSVPDWYQIQRNLSTAQGRENIETYLSKEQAYADYLRAVDLQMTQDSWAVLQRQLKLDTQTRTISDIRTIIFDYLREAMTYDETARTMNGSGDFLQYTLERSGHGYSVHYATAAVLMLRYMGVPARYVEGYYLSAEDAARYKAGETITLTEENAHAWAEYYVSGVGFVPFEVTPGYIDDEELSLGGDSPDENTYENNTQQFVEVEQPEEVNEHKQDRFTFSLNAHYLLLLPLLLILLLAGCIFHRRRVFRKKMAAIDAANDREAIAMRYGYAVCLLRHSTVQFSEDAAEAAELNQKALFSTQEMTPQQRKQVDSFAVRVLDACKGSWTTWEKIRYRLWNCLY